MILRDDKLLKLRLYKKGQQIIEEGSRTRTVFLQRSGITKIVKNHGLIQPIIISFGFPNELIGLSAILSNKKFQVGAVALEDVSGWMINSEKLMEYFENQGIKSQLLEHMSMEALILTERIGAMAHRSGTKRLLSILMMLSEIYGSTKDGKLAIYLTIKEISEIVMLSRETTHRIIRELENESLITIQSKHITFLNYQKLTQIVANQ